MKSQPDHPRRAARRVVAGTRKLTARVHASTVGQLSRPSQGYSDTQLSSARPSSQSRAVRSVPTSDSQRGKGRVSSSPSTESESRGRRSRGGQVSSDARIRVAPAPSRGDQGPPDTLMECVATPLLTDGSLSPVINVLAGEDATMEAAPTEYNVSPLADVVSYLRELHRQRQDYHSAEKRLTLQIKSIQRRIHAATGCQNPTHAKCSGVYDLESDTIQNLSQARSVFESQRKVFEKGMEKAAKSLPVFPWVKSVRGMGALGLAQIVAECGDLASYSNPAKVWKRMGVGLGPDREAYYEGRSPRRRAILYCIGDCLIKAGGPFKALYDERKAYEVARPACGRVFKTGGECRDAESGSCKKAHVHNRAKRYMEKRLLRDLWRAWRQEGATQ